MSSGLQALTKQKQDLQVSGPSRTYATFVDTPTVRHIDIFSFRIPINGVLCDSTPSKVMVIRTLIKTQNLRHFLSVRKRSTTIYNNLLR